MKWIQPSFEKVNYEERKEEENPYKISENFQSQGSEKQKIQKSSVKYKSQNVDRQSNIQEECDV